MTRPMRADARRNREQLLEVASDAFREHGVDASLEEIARRAGVGIGTLYRHFPSRDALLEAVFRRDVEQVADSAEELLRELPPDRALDEWMRSFVNYVAGKKGLATHLKTVLSADSPLFVYAHERMNASMRGLVAGRRRRPARSARTSTPLICCARCRGVCLAADEPGWQEQACRICSLLMDGLRYQNVPAAQH